MFKKISLFITGFIFCFSDKINAYAQFNSRGDVKLSEPIGGDILPGGKILEASSIEESFLFSQLIPFIISYALRLAIALTVIALIIGGYQYITAYGDEEKHKTAQKTITYAIVGLIISILAFGIVTIITNLQITS